MRSHLLRGKVRHRRSRPVTYDFEHEVYYFALDLSELAEVALKLRLVSRNRFNIFSFRDSDHLAPPATDLEADISDRLRTEGFDPRGWRTTLITNLRVLGYVFNPASFFLCRDASGVLRVVLVEVHNTHGDRRVYTLLPERSGTVHVGGMRKGMYVSPFIGMDATYRVRVQDDRSSVRIAISEEEEGAPVLTATLVLRRVRLTDRSLTRMLLRVPLVTHKTITLIHLHAWRLWRRGVTFHRHSAPAP